MSCLLRPEDIVDVENVVAVLIVITIILNTLARLRENTARIAGRLVFEVRIAYSVSRWQMAGKGL